MRTARTAILVLVVALVGFTSVGWAQEEHAGFRFEGDIEAGARFFLVEPSKTRKGKLEEYRDLTQGAFLVDLRLRLFDPDESYWGELLGSKWGGRDQEFGLSAGRVGLWKFGMEWDQTPHVISTTARFLATETRRGVFTLPTPRPPLAAHNSAPELDEIAVRWDTARFFLHVTPTPELDVQVEYTRTRKEGDKAFGMAFGSPGNNFYEILQPIEQTVHDFRVKATYARERWQIQLGYTLSVFDNDLKSVIANNPCFANVAACGAGDGGAAAPAAGRVSLAPDNMAHTVNIAGGISLPMRTRLSGQASYSVRLQNETFLPQTINPAFAADPNLALSHKSLNGIVGVLVLNVNATTHPVSPLTLSLRYRLFDYDDLSDEPFMRGHIVNDRGPVVVEERKSPRFGSQKQNVDIDGRWRFGAPLAVTVGTGWEHWLRNEAREVRRSDELFAKAAVDVTPLDWFSARLTYRPSVRRIRQYETFNRQEHIVFEELAPDDKAVGQSTRLRKFDEGEVNRQRLDLLLQFFPTDALSTTVSGGWKHDDYVSSPLGLQEATSWSAGFDVTWRPLERVALSGGYVHELIFQQQRSRVRAVVGGAVVDTATNDWISANTDTIDTINFAATVSLIPRVLDWASSANYAYALGAIQTRGVRGQVLAGSSRPQSFPDFEDGYLRLESVIRYHFTKAWTANFGYAFESFQKNDWRTDRLSPFNPGVTSIWLGNDTRNYSAHIATATLAYHFR